ncbi:MAG: hypothetical protein A3C50_02140 [Candidatus Staskawiczbacteria bacterium RIFCSPHIGHO2_02_FULL_43_16]|uniref:Uncharacterized protein n=1 Tax=Candidatus Staskawiczbacteria bacterium RIFCSPHIGHO2_01_FULL_41_41 TaxID=1802203 RepID=A0A1G2HVU3_9BACT|nr:MAG: hypothetical protein A2822_00510 [Candidatus Staskawiczbacteria bacterium RIFCSPHIGHO2_01_FULL_41_41]OGZ68477.1 MAG: hypothetical protein A3C50_02140 [Candidatus Staskawiczbacteria bacterium RIFCSPHIGHO2_02_FULL_43_16]OGZ74281.1 MAG: hypothetical protein A3A12_02575 [Candidatus Staskawiczbacteria bacterium RIFCSPLOWO2_01_FULL_43_17b]
MSDILDIDGYKIGSISEDGKVHNKKGYAIGRVSIDGNVFNASGGKVGTFKPDGHVYKMGEYVGDVKTDGKVYDNDEDYVGRVKGEHIISGGAALLLLII